MESIDKINQRYIYALSSDNVADKVFELAFMTGDINLIRLYLNLKEENILEMEKEIEKDLKNNSNYNIHTKETFNSNDYEV